MGERAAHETGVRLTVLVDVVGVPATARDEALVLLADHPRADALLDHRALPYSAACGRPFIEPAAARIALTMLW